MSEANWADYQWLVGDEGRQWLRRAGERTGTLVKRIGWLRKELSPFRAHLILEQLDLRRRAVVKFESASQLFLTDKGLQQATDCWVGRYKASRFPKDAPVADLCCGIGGDLLALADRGPVVGYDRDPIIALLARTNCQTVQAATAQVRQGDAEAVSVADFAAWHVDPDRRGQGRRVSHPADYVPPLELLASWLERNPQAAVKLAPATAVPDGWRQSAEREWISSRGECRQQVVWFGELAHHAGRSVATILPGGRRQLGGQAQSGGQVPLGGQGGLGGQGHAGGRGAPRTLVEQENVPRESPLGCSETASGPGRVASSPLGDYLFEPDNAVLAAGLVDELVVELGLRRLAPGVAYLTGDRPIADLAVACFEVLEQWPFDVKRLRTALRQRRIGRLEIKKRGLPLDPEDIRRRLQLRGDESASLLVAPLGGHATAILARRLEPARLGE